MTWLVRDFIRAGSVVLWTGSNAKRVNEAADFVRSQIEAAGTKVYVLPIDHTTSGADFDCARVLADAGAVVFAIGHEHMNVSLYLRHVDACLAVGSDGWCQVAKGHTRTVSQHYRALVIEPRPEVAI